MYHKISNHTAYEKNTGKQHIFEVFKCSDTSSECYVLLDGCRLAYAKNEKVATDTVLGTISWYGWVRNMDEVILW